MIITCEQCTTRFQLDDSRVPEQGVRVRCSRCQHAFYVKPGSGSGTDLVESAVAEALEDSADDPLGDSLANATTPSALAKPPQRESESPAEQRASEGPATQRESESSGEQRESESDWEFNHDDDPGHDAALADAQGMVDDLLGPGASEDAEVAAKAEYFGSGDDVEGELAALLGEDEVAPDHVDVTPTGMETPQQELQSASDSISGLADTEADDAESGLDLGDDEDDSFDPADAPAPDGEVSNDAAQVSASSGNPLADLSGDELGSPDEWNFFDDDADPAAAAAAEPAPGKSRTVLAQIQVGPPGSFDIAGTPDELPVLEREPSPVADWVVRAGAGVGWAATAALLAAVVTLGFGQRSAPPVAETASVGLADVRARRIDNASAGPLILVEATLDVREAAAAGSGERYAVQLLDASGAVLSEDAASLGPAQTEYALREGSPAMLRETLERAARAAAWRPASPTRPRTLHALLTTAPAEATRFEIVRVPVEAPAPAVEAAQPPDATAG